MVVVKSTLFNCHVRPNDSLTAILEYIDILKYKNLGGAIAKDQPIMPA